MKFNVKYDESGKIEDYLFLLNEQLKYMFSNIDDENFSEDLSKRYVRKDKNFSIVEANARKISWVIKENNEGGFTLSKRAIELFSKDIKIEGAVKFSDLSGNKTTEIHAGNIKTGKISADRIRGGTLNGVTLNGSRIISTTINSANVYGTKINAGNIIGTKFSGGTLNFGKLYADSNRTRIGDFFCSFNKTYNFQDIKYTFVVQRGDVHLVRVTTTSTGNTYSDARMKKNVKEIKEEASEFIKRLNPVTFTRKDTKEEGIGFIAQEVEELLNEMGLEWSITNENGDYKTIGYESFVPIITAAVQEIARNESSL